MFYLYLIIFAIFGILIIFKLYKKIKYKFWANQPIFHAHNLYYWIYKQGIINNELPKTNRYCNFYNILVTEEGDRSVFDFTPSTPTLKEGDTPSTPTLKGEIPTLKGEISTLEYIVKFLQDKEPVVGVKKTNPSLLTLSTLSSYFVGCNSKSFISTYRKGYSFDSNIPIRAKLRIQQAVGVEGVKSKTDLSPSAVMTTRPLNVTFKNILVFKIYYIDYLCVEKYNNNSGIIDEMFQTHEYIQRHKNPNIKVTLFKREKKIPGIVALTTYKIYQFEIKHIPKQSLLHASMQVIEINKLNIRLLTTLIHSQRNKLDCFILPDLTNLLNIINNETYKVYGILVKDVLISCYFFRNSYIQNDVIEFFASISDCYYEIFITGFFIAIKKIKTKHITIENISHNNIIINYLFLLNIIPKFTNSSFYYFYNYIKKPILPENIFILS